MEFGGAHTKIKLNVLAAYLQFYVKALKNQNYHLVYIDAFAGTGDMIITASKDSDLFSGSQATETYQGSVRRALALPFHSYWLAERNRARFKRLQQNLSELPAEHRDRIRLYCGDSDQILRKWASEIRGKIDGKEVRAVVFLDPFGMSLSYETMKAIGDTKRADVWFLVPTGMGPSRRAKLEIKSKSDFNQRITRMLGTLDWQKAWYTESRQVTLEGHHDPILYRTADIIKMEAYIFNRINSAFNGGGLRKTLTLGVRKRRWYMLMFACSNPSKNARRLAFQAAEYIIKAQQN
jgi:three-Cys-motif partner protein